MKFLYSIFIFLCLSQNVDAKMVTIRGQIQTTSGNTLVESVRIQIVDIENNAELIIIQVDSSGQFEAQVKIRNDYHLLILSVNYEIHSQYFRLHWLTPKFIEIELIPREFPLSEESLSMFLEKGYSIDTFPMIDSVSIKGQIIADNFEPVMFATIVLYQNEKILMGTQTNLDGYFSFSNIPKGNYRMKAMYVGYHNCEIPKVEISENQTVNIVGILINGVDIEVMEINCGPNIINADDLTRGTIYTSYEIQRSPHKQ